MSLVMLVPTKNRPQNASRLLHACKETAGDELENLLFAVDPDERLLEEYRQVIPKDPPDWDWVTLLGVSAEPQRIGPMLNKLAVHHAERYDFIGFMGDDHLPRTPGWDVELTASLGGKPGVAYGNDLVQSEKLPTAVIISSVLVRSLGYMLPPGLEHLYFDDFWLALGRAVGNLRYSRDVIIEHMHPTVGAAQWDDSYRQNNDPAQFSRDNLVYDVFLNERWADDCYTMKKELGL